MSFNLFLQYLLPKHSLSRLVAKLADCRIPFIKNFIISWYCRFYHIDMTEALEPNYLNYPTFNDFFIRILRPDVRPIAADPRAIISPVDGKIWQIGEVSTNLINAKGKNFTLEQLLANKEDAEQFKDASFAVLYLAPDNYHRIHMPMGGELCSMRYVPGTLFSVQPRVVNYLPEVFAKNERVISLFKTGVGQVAIIFVGAIFVASIETKWAGVVAPNEQNKITHWDYPEPKITFERGAEIGRFKLGSTVIMLFPKSTIKWDAHLGEGVSIKMGQKLGELL